MLLRIYICMYVRSCSLAYVCVCVDVLQVDMTARYTFGG